MATIKSFTSIEQSRKLAEILPLESADMKILPFTEREYRIVPINDISVCGREDEIYAWSLAALLAFLPNSAFLERGSVTELYRVTLPVELEAFDWYIEPLDACYEMIIKLHELKML